MSIWFIFVICFIKVFIRNVDRGWIYSLIECNVIFISIKMWWEVSVWKCGEVIGKLEIDWYFDKWVEICD